MDEQWHYSHEGSQFGPVSTAALRQLATTGQLLPSDLIWKEGMPDWTVAGNTQGLFPAANIQFASSERMAGPQNLPPPLRNGGSRAGDADIVYAGFVRRFAALLLDSLILVIPSMVIAVAIAIPFGVLSGNSSEQAQQAVGQAIGFFVSIVVAVVYFVLQESSAHQATLGKRALGIKVTDNTGARISFAHALGRFFAKVLSYLTLYIGFLMAGFTDRKRALHDMVAGTLVVDRWAYTEFPERQQRSASGCLIAIVVGFILVIPVGSILAAIAISQYQDYVIRSQVSEGSALADGVKTAIGEFYNNNGRFPLDNTSAGLAAPASITGAYVSSVDIGSGDGTISVTYSSSPPEKASTMLDGKTILFVPSVNGQQIEWQCKSADLKQKWCSSRCECGG